MATLEYVKYVQYLAVHSGGKLELHLNEDRKAIEGLPQIYWSDGTPWIAACLWARERAASRMTDIKTVQSNMRHLHAYADFLEDIETDWRHFPQRKEDRALVRWRGALIAANEKDQLASSTMNQRMNATINFYRFAASNGLINQKSRLWQDRTKVIRYFDSIGFERTLNIVSTDISIPNRRTTGNSLEDGLEPLSKAHIEELLKFTAVHCSYELHLLLLLGIYTGGRISTLATLRLESIAQAIPDPLEPSMYRLFVGPSAHPPVRTKYGVNGQILIPIQLLNEVRKYMHSVRRLSREAIASQENKNLVFLTRFGNAYVERDLDRSPAINQEMASLRRTACQAGLWFMKDFKFHQTRATFGTWLMQICLEVGDPVSAIAFVKNAMLHKREGTTFKYAKFTKDHKIKANASRKFAEAFSGLAQRANDS